MTEIYIYIIIFFLCNNVLLTTLPILIVQWELANYFADESVVDRSVILKYDVIQWYSVVVVVVEQFKNHLCQEIIIKKKKKHGLGGLSA